MTVVGAAKDVFTKKNIKADQLPAAMENPLPLDEANETQQQASEVLTHLAFYAGWPNVSSALPVAKSVFEKRPALSVK
jgi:alkylhydroperoxidase/carboxymuconolactone decarboxylase family protein YurZ